MNLQTLSFLDDLLSDIILDRFLDFRTHKMNQDYKPLTFKPVENSDSALHDCHPSSTLQDNGPTTITENGSRDMQSTVARSQVAHQPLSATNWEDGKNNLDLLKCELLDIIQVRVIVNSRVSEAVEKVLEIRAVKEVLEARAKETLDLNKDNTAGFKECFEKLQNDFRVHARRYLGLYQPRAGIEIGQTDRYTAVTNKSEACVIANLSFYPGDQLRYCTGTIAALTEQEEKELEHDTKDFSVIRTSRRGTCLFLGPARFVNHDCDPNCEFIPAGQEAISFKVIKPIQVGEEITTKYGDNYFGPNNRECLCATCERLQQGAFSKNAPAEEEEEAATPDMLDDEEPMTRRLRSRNTRAVPIMITPPRQASSPLRTQSPDIDTTIRPSEVAPPTPDEEQVSADSHPYPSMVDESMKLAMEPAPITRSKDSRSDEEISAALVLSTLASSSSPEALQPISTFKADGDNTVSENTLSLDAKQDEVFVASLRDDLVVDDLCTALDGVHVDDPITLPSFHTLLNDVENSFISCSSAHNTKDSAITSATGDSTSVPSFTSRMSIDFLINHSYDDEDSSGTLSPPGEDTDDSDQDMEMSPSVHAEDMSSSSGQSYARSSRCTRGKQSAQSSAPKDPPGMFTCSNCEIQLPEKDRGDSLKCLRCQRHFLIFHVDWPKRSKKRLLEHFEKLRLAEKAKQRAEEIARRQEQRARAREEAKKQQQAEKGVKRQAGQVAKKQGGKDGVSKTSSSKSGTPASTAHSKVLHPFQQRPCAVFVDPHDDGCSLFWWPAITIPLHQMTPRMPSLSHYKQLQQAANPSESSTDDEEEGADDDKVLVRYLEDNTYSICTVDELKVLHPEIEPYTTYASQLGDTFLSHQAVTRATRFVREGWVPEKFRWKEMDPEKRYSLRRLKDLMAIYTRHKQNLQKGLPSTSGDAVAHPSALSSTWSESTSSMRVASASPLSPSSESTLSQANSAATLFDQASNSPTDPSLKSAASDKSKSSQASKAIPAKRKVHIDEEDVANKPKRTRKQKNIVSPRVFGKRGFPFFTDRLVFSPASPPASDIWAERVELPTFLSNSLTSASSPMSDTQTASPWILVPQSPTYTQKDNSPESAEPTDPITAKEVSRISSSILSSISSFVTSWLSEQSTCAASEKENPTPSTTDTPSASVPSTSKEPTTSATDTLSKAPKPKSRKRVPSASETSLATSSDQPKIPVALVTAEPTAATPDDPIAAKKKRSRKPSSATLASTATASTASTSALDTKVTTPAAPDSIYATEILPVTTECLASTMSEVAAVDPATPTQQEPTGISVPLASKKRVRNPSSDPKKRKRKGELAPIDQPSATLTADAIMPLEDARFGISALNVASEITQPSLLSTTVFDPPSSFTFVAESNIMLDSTTTGQRQTFREPESKSKPKAVRKKDKPAEQLTQPTVDQPAGESMERQTEQTIEPATGLSVEQAQQPVRGTPKPKKPRKKKEKPSTEQPADQPIELSGVLRANNASGQSTGQDQAPPEKPKSKKMGKKVELPAERLVELSGEQLAAMQDEQSTEQETEQIVKPKPKRVRKKVEAQAEQSAEQLVAQAVARTVEAKPETMQKVAVPPAGSPNDQSIDVLIHQSMSRSLDSPVDRLVEQPQGPKEEPQPKPEIRKDEAVPPVDHAIGQVTEQTQEVKPIQKESCREVTEQGTEQPTTPSAEVSIVIASGGENLVGQSTGQPTEQTQQSAEVPKPKKPRKKVKKPTEPSADPNAGLQSEQAGTPEVPKPRRTKKSKPEKLANQPTEQPSEPSSAQVQPSTDQLAAQSAKLPQKSTEESKPKKIRKKKVEKLADQATDPVLVQQAAARSTESPPIEPSVEQHAIQPAILLKESPLGRAGGKSAEPAQESVEKPKPKSGKKALELSEGHDPAEEPKLKKGGEKKTNMPTEPLTEQPAEATAEEAQVSAQDQKPKKKRTRKAAEQPSEPPATGQTPEQPAGQVERKGNKVPSKKNQEPAPESQPQVAIASPAGLQPSAEPRPQVKSEPHPAHIQLEAVHFIKRNRGVEEHARWNREMKDLAHWSIKNSTLHAHEADAESSRRGRFRARNARIPDHENMAETACPDSLPNLSPRSLYPLAATHESDFHPLPATERDMPPTLETPIMAVDKSAEHNPTDNVASIPLLTVRPYAARMIDVQELSSAFIDIDGETSDEEQTPLSPLHVTISQAAAKTETKDEKGDCVDTPDSSEDKENMDQSIKSAKKAMTAIRSTTKQSSAPKQARVKKPAQGQVQSRLVPDQGQQSLHQPQSTAEGEGDGIQIVDEIVDTQAVDGGKNDEEVGRRQAQESSLKVEEEDDEEEDKENEVPSQAALQDLPRELRDLAFWTIKNSNLKGSEVNRSRRPWPSKTKGDDDEDDDEGSETEDEKEEELRQKQKPKEKKVRQQKLQTKKGETKTTNTSSSMSTSKIKEPSKPAQSRTKVVKATPMGEESESASGKEKGEDDPSKPEPLASIKRNRELEDLAYWSIKNSDLDLDEQDEDQRVTRSSKRARYSSKTTTTTGASNHR